MSEVEFGFVIGGIIVGGMALTFGFFIGILI